MSDIIEGHYKDLKLKIQGLVPAGQDLHRQVLFDQLYSSIPKDPKARVQVYTAEIVPMGWTNFHCHNGATFFLALQGIFVFSVHAARPSRATRRMRAKLGAAQTAAAYSEG